MSAPITLHTESTATANQFATYWTTGHKQGVVVVSIQIPEASDAAIVAELAALHHLLSHRAVFGADRAGNGLQISVSFGAIRKLARGVSSKSHLLAHSRFLSTRYVDASITVAKDHRWVDPARASTRKETLTVTHPLPEVVNVPAMGPVGVSVHVVERLMQRANFPSMAACWHHLQRTLGDPSLQVIKLPPEILRHKVEKYGRAAGIHLAAPHSPWHFVVSDGQLPSSGGLPMLVTAYVRR